MSRNLSHLNTARQVILNFKGELPLSAFLKNFFAKEKKYGSRDRRAIATYCFDFYRLGKALNQLTVEEKILASNFVIEVDSNNLLAELQPEWNNKIQLPLPAKLALLNLNSEDIFPFNFELSGNVATILYNLSFLLQPKLFIRIRPGKKSLIENKLEIASVQYEQVSDDCLAFDNGIRLDDILEINKDYVVQDYNSQKVFSLLSFLFSAPGSLHIWDCCAASGGKSIMAVDSFKDIQLTVSDVRATILNNLHHRLRQAGIKNYHSLQADLTETAHVEIMFSNRPFDLVICDAPCSGSGTWSRTPEQLTFFKPDEIDRYSMLQKKIAGNVISSIKKGGHLLYITCSVFAKENEEVVNFLNNNYPVKLVKMELFTGYTMRADSLFAALFEVT